MRAGALAAPAEQLQLRAKAKAKIEPERGPSVNGAGLRTHIRVLILECSLPTRSPSPSPSSRGSGRAELLRRLRRSDNRALRRPAMEPVFALTEPPSDFLEVFDRDGWSVPRTSRR